MAAAYRRMVFMLTPSLLAKHQQVTVLQLPGNSLCVRDGR